MYIYNPNMYVEYGDRQVLVPFLVGALAGGAAIGLTRPRPIYNVAPSYSQYPVYPYGSTNIYGYNYSGYPIYK